MNKRKLGTQYEILVKKKLEISNVKILESNYRNRKGEIDLILKDGEYICFVEIKFRSNEDFGLPEDAVGFKKKKTICNVAKNYICEKKLYLDTPIRFDVITIINREIKWYKNAFDFI